MVKSTIFLGLLSFGLAILIGYVSAHPQWGTETEYGARSPEFRTEQGQNTNYGSSRTGTHYGDDYKRAAAASHNPRHRRHRGRGGGGGGRPPKQELLNNANRHGPPYTDEDTYVGAADESAHNRQHNRGWGPEVHTEKIVEKHIVHHVHHRKKKPKKQSLIPSLKIVPFGVKLIPFKLKIQTPKIKIRRPSIHLVPG